MNAEWWMMMLLNDTQLVIANESWARIQSVSCDPQGVDFVGLYHSLPLLPTPPLFYHYFYSNHPPTFSKIHLLLPAFPPSPFNHTHLPLSPPSPSFLFQKKQELSPKGFFIHHQWSAIDYCSPSCLRLFLRQ